MNTSQETDRIYHQMVSGIFKLIKFPFKFLDIERYENVGVGENSFYTRGFLKDDVENVKVNEISCFQVSFDDIDSQEYSDFIGDLKKNNIQFITRDNDILIAPYPAEKLDIDNEAYLNNICNVLETKYPNVDIEPESYKEITGKEYSPDWRDKYKEQEREENKDEQKETEKETERKSENDKDQEEVKEEQEENPFAAFDDLEPGELDAFDEVIYSDEIVTDEVKIETVIEEISENNIEMEENPFAEFNNLEPGEVDSFDGVIYSDKNEKSDSVIDVTDYEEVALDDVKHSDIAAEEEISDNFWGDMEEEELEEDERSLDEESFEENEEVKEEEEESKEEENQEEQLEEDVPEEEEFEDPNKKFYQEQADAAVQQQYEEVARLAQEAWNNQAYDNNSNYDNSSYYDNQSYDVNNDLYASQQLYTNGDEQQLYSQQSAVVQEQYSESYFREDTLNQQYESNTQQYYEQNQVTQEYSSQNINSSYVNESYNSDSVSRGYESDNYQAQSYSEVNQSYNSTVQQSYQETTTQFDNYAGNRIDSTQVNISAEMRQQLTEQLIASAKAGAYYESDAATYRERTLNSHYSNTVFSGADIPNNNMSGQNYGSAAFGHIYKEQNITEQTVVKTEQTTVKTEQQFAEGSSAKNYVYGTSGSGSHTTIISNNAELFAKDDNKMALNRAKVNGSLRNNQPNYFLWEMSRQTSRAVAGIAKTPLTAVKGTEVGKLFETPGKFASAIKSTVSENLKSSANAYRMANVVHNANTEVSKYFSDHKKEFNQAKFASSEYSNMASARRSLIENKLILNEQTKELKEVRKNSPNSIREENLKQICKMSESNTLIAKYEYEKAKRSLADREENIKNKMTFGNEKTKKDLSNDYLQGIGKNGMNASIAMKRIESDFKAGKITEKERIGLYNELAKKGGDVKHKHKSIRMTIIKTGMRELSARLTSNNEAIKQINKSIQMSRRVVRVVRNVAKLHKKYRVANSILRNTLLKRDKLGAKIIKFDEKVKATLKKPFVMAKKFANVHVKRGFRFIKKTRPGKAFNDKRKKLVVKITHSKPVRAYGRIKKIGRDINEVKRKIYNFTPRGMLNNLKTKVVSAVANKLAKTALGALFIKIKAIIFAVLAKVILIVLALVIVCALLDGIVDAIITNYGAQLQYVYNMYESTQPKYDDFDDTSFAAASHTMEALDYVYYQIPRFLSLTFNTVDTVNDYVTGVIGCIPFIGPALSDGADRVADAIARATVTDEHNNAKTYYLAHNGSRGFKSPGSIQYYAYFRGQEDPKKFSANESINTRWLDGEATYRFNTDHITSFLIYDGFKKYNSVYKIEKASAQSYTSISDSNIKPTDDLSNAVGSVYFNELVVDNAQYSLDEGQTLIVYVDETGKRCGKVSNIKEILSMCSVAFWEDTQTEEDISTPAETLWDRFTGLAAFPFSVFRKVVDMIGSAIVNYLEEHMNAELVPAWLFDANGRADTMKQAIYCASLYISSHEIYMGYAQGVNGAASLYAHKGRNRSSGDFTNYYTHWDGDNNKFTIGNPNLICEGVKISRKPTSTSRSKGYGANYTVEYFTKQGAKRDISLYNANVENVSDSSIPGEVIPTSGKSKDQMESDINSMWQWNTDWEDMSSMSAARRHILQFEATYLELENNSSINIAMNGPYDVDFSGGNLVAKTDEAQIYTNWNQGFKANNIAEWCLEDALQYNRFYINVDNPNTNADDPFNPKDNKTVSVYYGWCPGHPRIAIYLQIYTFGQDQGLGENEKDDKTSGTYNLFDKADSNAFVKTMELLVKERGIFSRQWSSARYDPETKKYVYDGNGVEGQSEPDGTRGYVEDDFNEVVGFSED